MKQEWDFTYPTGINGSIGVKSKKLIDIPAILREPHNKIRLTRAPLIAFIELKIVNFSFNSLFFIYYNFKSCL